MFKCYRSLQTFHPEYVEVEQRHMQQIFKFLKTIIDINPPLSINFPLHIILFPFIPHHSITPKNNFSFHSQHSATFIHNTRLHPMLIFLPANTYTQQGRENFSGFSFFLSCNCVVVCRARELRKWIESLVAVWTFMSLDAELMIRNYLRWLHSWRGFFL